MNNSLTDTFMFCVVKEKKNLHGVVQVGVFVKEPQHSVVGLGMDTLLLEQSDLVVLICE